MSTEKELSLTEFSAFIRNKIQATKTVLELLSTGRKVPNKFIKKAFRDLDKVVEIIS